MAVDVVGAEEYGLDEVVIKKVIQDLLDKESRSNSLIVVMFVDDVMMRKLNSNYHDVDEVTDVLSWPYEDPESNRDKGLFVHPEHGTMPMGEIALCYTRIQHQAKDKGKSIEEEVVFLLKHGMEHVMGRHHE